MTREQGPLVFMTGATGFVGTALARMLHERGYRLRCLLRPGSDESGLFSIPFERVEGDLGDEAALEEGIRNTDFVVHLAAKVGFAKKDREECFEVNAGGTARVARIARRLGTGRMLHVSSVSAVGYSDRPVLLDERQPYNFDRLGIPYCDSKHLAEKAVLEEVSRGLDAVLANPASMVGPGDRRKGRGSLLEAVAEGRIPFHPPGGVNIVDLRDACAGMLALMEGGRTGERYILGGFNLRGRELLETAAAVARGRPPRFTLPRPLALLLASAATAWETFFPLKGPVTAQILRLSPRFLWYSSRKAEEEVGYAVYPIEMAFKEAFDWMRRVEDDLPRP